MPASDATATGPDSLPELLRIMDVATALRRERERATAQLDHNATVQKLRERLLATAEATGEPVTPAEVDTAIRRYFDTRHEYRDPPRSLQWMLAHLYVRRKPIAIMVTAAAVVFFAVWWLFGSTASPLSSAGREERRLSSAYSIFVEHRDLARAVAVEPEVIAELERLDAEVGAHRDAHAVAALEGAAQHAAELARQLDETFSVHVVSRQGQRSGVRRDVSLPDSPVSGYYLVVEARTDSGGTLRRRIRNAETQTEREVTIWAEQVPEAVYDRVAADKRADGIVDDDVFAVKERGRLRWTIRMQDADGTPLQRRRQITDW